MDMQANTPPDFTLKTDRDRDLSAEQVVVAYHERTKHHYHRYAMEDRVQGQMIKAAAAWARGGSWC